MPAWWTRLFRRRVQPEGPHRSAEVRLVAAAEAFVRPSLTDYRLPDSAALAKARALLEGALTIEQRRDLFARGYFCVKGNRFSYRIREGHAGNVDALDPSGRVVGRYCAHPLGRIPVHDVMLAQKLWLETDEDMFLREASPYPLHLHERGCRVPPVHDANAR